MREATVLGVDPGLSATGYAVVTALGERFALLTSGTIRTRARIPIQERLAEIHDALFRVMEAFSPEAVAVEDVYLARNAPSAMATAEVVGVVKLLARGKGLHTYAPRQVKNWICGNGCAPKEQVVRMVENLLEGPGIGSDHAADAAALAICAILERAG